MPTDFVTDALFASMSLPAHLSAPAASHMGWSMGMPMAQMPSAGATVVAPTTVGDGRNNSAAAPTATSAAGFATTRAIVPTSRAAVDVEGDAASSVTLCTPGPQRVRTFDGIASTALKAASFPTPGLTPGPMTTHAVFPAPRFTPGPTTAHTVFPTPRFTPGSTASHGAFPTPSLTPGPTVQRSEGFEGAHCLPGLVLPTPAFSSKPVSE
jgi:hypothetical protein